MFSGGLDGELRFARTRVLLEPHRLRFLLRGGLDDALDLRRFLVHVVPLAKAALADLERLAARIPDADLRGQALSSLTSKAYHVAGAGILATFLHSAAREHYLEIVAPLETIYDFLDSLCDRHPGTPVKAFRQLHEALADALDPERPLGDYYVYGPAGDDGGYLSALVRRVRSALIRLGSYELLVPHFSRAAALFADTQTYKHLPVEQREPALRAWHARERAQAEDLSWWEFGAAAGSQFHVYGPLYAAFCSSFDRSAQTYDAYFPSFAALHVLLDSFIDRDEDREHGELNWVAQYPGTHTFLERAHVMAERARARFGALEMPRAHRFALRIMTLFYLTHPKIAAQRLEREAISLLDTLS